MILHIKDIAVEPMYSILVKKRAILGAGGVLEVRTDVLCRCPVAAGNPHDRSCP
jgi:hypothetical protein